MLSWGNLKPPCPLGKLVHFEELQAAKWPVGAHKLLFPAKISNIATSARSPHIPKLASRSSHRSQVSHWSWVRPKSEQCELLRHSTGMFSLPQTHHWFPTSAIFGASVCRYFLTLNLYLFTPALFTPRCSCNRANKINKLQKPQKYLDDHFLWLFSKPLHSLHPTNVEILVITSLVCWPFFYC